MENALKAETTVHWHGLRVPNAMDGVPQLTQPVGFWMRFMDSPFGANDLRQGRQDRERIPQVQSRCAA